MSVAVTELLEENRALQRVLAERDEKIAALEKQVARIAELEQEIEALERELRGAARDRATLEARLEELLARRRALGDLDAPGQLELFVEEAPVPTPPCAKEAPDGETSTDEIRRRHRRTNAPREMAYAALPRKHVQHELAPAERICPVTGKTLVAIGEKESEELEYRPAKLVVLVHHRAVYGLGEEDRKERTIEPLVAPAPPRPIENGLAGAGLLAWILVQKYCNHLPLYRQQAIFEREGLAPSARLSGKSPARLSGTDSTLATKNPALIEAGCWAHVLRKFRDALKESPVEALRMLRKIGKLFDVEKAALEAKLEPEAVRALRLERCPPLLAEIQSELESMRGSGSDQGPLAKALTYLANQWPTLVRFLEDGRVPIHNNSCENAIRPVAVGRRNWLFAGSERGGHAAATIYSLIESCRRVGVDPFVYLRDVLVRVGTHPAARVDDLMPERWKEIFGSKIVR